MLVTQHTLNPGHYDPIFPPFDLSLHGFGKDELPRRQCDAFV